MPGERYCVYGSKARRFKKRDAAYSVPRWCPRLLRPLAIRVYVREPETYLDFMLRKKFGDSVPQYVDPHKYILRTTGDTALTPAQFCKELTSGFADYTELLGRYPHENDVIEISNGLSSAYLHYTKHFKWEQLWSFDTAKCDDGSIGGIAVRPHDNQELGRFYHISEDYETGCIGYMRGYFTEGRFQSHREEGRQELALPSMWEECEALVETLKTDGFLRGLEQMQDYCSRFPLGELPGKGEDYGYIADAGNHRFYIRCLPDGENYHVYLYVYPKK